MRQQGMQQSNLSFDAPSINVITQGKTLIPSLSTSQGTFSTKTRMKSVLKYLGASFWRCLSMISHRLNLWWKKWITQRGLFLLWPISHPKKPFAATRVARKRARTHSAG